MDVAKVGQVLAVMLSPSLIVGALLYLPRGVRATRRLLVSDARPDDQPSRRPIELIAADLRRLLERHETIRRSVEMVVRARRLRAVEGAIADCATEAAEALELPVPAGVTGHELTTPESRRLLRALAEAGLVLPPIGLLAADGRS